MEERTPLTPEGAAELMRSGFKVTVERSQQSAYDSSAYQEVGCEMAQGSSWVDAPEDAIILGLKELPDDTFPLAHDHIFFAHAYKEQRGWQDLLARFVQGGGKLYDLEYLVDANKRRIAAFGYWAGFAGCAAGLLAWAGCRRNASLPLASLSSYNNKDELIREITSAVSDAGERPRVIVIGALGRCGTGASDAANAAGCEVTEWDLEETKAGGPFKQINDMDVFVNCVFIDGELPPFVTMEMLSQQGRQLSVVVDVSCDVNSSYNPVPIYTKCTDFDDPCQRVIGGDNPLHVIAIDHLPSLLPLESSEDFGSQLLKHLLHLRDEADPVWQGALDVFEAKTRELR
jgi:hypothetical protein